MDQRSIVLYLARNAVTAMEIYNDLVLTLGSDTKGHSSVTRFLREAKFLFLKKAFPSTIPTKLSSLPSTNSRSHQFASYQDSRTYLEVRSTGG
jgi:hypothetical protein